MAGDTFYIGTGIWAAAVLAIFIMAIRLSYKIEARSEGLRNRTGVPQRAQLLHTVTNWKVARDAETQALRRRMNGLLLAVLVAMILFAVAVMVIAPSQTV